MVRIDFLMRFIHTQFGGRRGQVKSTRRRADYHIAVEIN